MKEFPSIFILTGAGVSAESGIATFRGAGGLWEGHRVEDVASPEGFRRNPSLVYRFYNERRCGIRDKLPNDAHRGIARLQREYPGKVTLVTQNIDDLHERGGSPEVLHMHGEIFKARCGECGGVSPWMEDLDGSSQCGDCGGPLRPHIVWFGEVPLELDTIFEALDSADIFAAIGTSGNVYPAAGFVDHARRRRARCHEFNLEETASSALFHEVHAGPAGRTVTDWVDKLLQEAGSR
ncbi:MAG: cobB 3 [Verrucomicrobiales bacterium]|nr:cobB 3 [Verrucomicrobiales bacterium]